jgi:hypothetical protein
MDFGPRDPADRAHTRERQRHRRVPPTPSAEAGRPWWWCSPAGVGNRTRHTAARPARQALERERYDRGRRARACWAVCRGPTCASTGQRGAAAVARRSGNPRPGSPSACGKGHKGSGGSPRVLGHRGCMARRGPPPEPRLRRSARSDGRRGPGRRRATSRGRPGCGGGGRSRGSAGPTTTSAGGANEDVQQARPRLGLRMARPELEGPATGRRDRLGTQRHEILGWPEARADPTSGTQRLVSYLVSTTPSGGAPT